MTTLSPRAAGALVLWLGLAACAAGHVDPDPRAGATGTWPPAWSGAADPLSIDFTPAPFNPPRADHCRRAPALRETSDAGAAWRQRREPAAARAPATLPPATLPRERAALDRPADTTAKSSGETAREALSADRAERVDPAGRVDRDGSSEREKSALSSLARAPSQSTPMQRPAGERVQAGMVDDNADFGAYLAYRARHPGLAVRERDIAERYLLQVSDAHGRPVHDAEVAIQRAGVAEPLAWARTDTAGKVWLHPRAFMAPVLQGESGALGVAVRKGASQARATLQRGQAHAVQVRLDAAATGARSRLDLVFMVDATGSMGDEIAKLKVSMRQMAQQIADLPSRPELCYALVAYRDRGDAFLTRSLDFTDDLSAFQAELARLQAAGGGDTPEALNEALHEVVHGLSWRAEAARLVVLVADAPPHLDYGGPQYDRDMQAALAKGIKIFAVGASGLDEIGEYVFRQIAQYTAGRFVFLTYRDPARPELGTGSRTPHDVSGYSVESLDRLIVRLVGEEMARLARG